MIKKDDSSRKFNIHIKQKIKKIQNTEEIIIKDKNLKESMVYFNYTNNQIENLKSFFEFLKEGVLFTLCFENLKIFFY